MRPFLVCIHDATPAYARETRSILRELAPLLGRRLSLAVVSNWHGEWPLAAHPAYCRLIQEASEELLLHGFFHRRRRGGGPITLLTGGSDEMNGLDPEETRCILERGQSVFSDAFGKPARGFLAPGWQRGHVSPENVDALGLEHVLGFFSLESKSGRSLPLATWTWDCGRWGWLGYVGHGIGWLLDSVRGGVPSVAIHPRDLEAGFWRPILRLIEELLESGYEPSTAAGLLESWNVEAAI